MSDTERPYEPHGPERCATCGKNVAPDSAPSYSLVEWDGEGNALIGMFCLDHPPIPQPDRAQNDPPSPCRCRYVEGYGLDRTACRTDVHNDPPKRPRCPVHDMPDCSPLLNGCSWRPADTGDQ